MILPNNDSGCGWIHDLPTRRPTPPLTKTVRCKWLVIGAGYTGLSAARKLAEQNPSDHIVLLDAQVAGEGASSRNSGYLVDSTLNDGHLKEAGLNDYLAKYALNRRGLEAVRTFVNSRQIDCDWNECGKFHASHGEANHTKLAQFSDTLAECGINHDVFSGKELHERLGTSYYSMAVHTHGGVMLHPGKLARAMVDCLPGSVFLYENSPVTHWQTEGSGYRVDTPKGSVQCEKLIVCTNGFLPSLKLESQRVFPLTLTASLTRPLTDPEWQSIGTPLEWGVLSAQAMGATVRFTSDRRIMIRNTAEAITKINFTESDLRTRIKTHQKGLSARFPSLPENMITSTWSGVTCVSGNNAQVFKKAQNNLWLAGCYNGGGIGLATLFGEQIALKACGEKTKAITAIESRPKPNWLPPNPFLRWGVQTRLFRDALLARNER